LTASPAQAARSLISEEAVLGKQTPAGQIEGACGVAVAPGGQIYASDYYHRVVDVFGSGGGYQFQVSAGTAPRGPCGLAAGPGGALYVNYYHQGVARLLPTAASFDQGSSTGVAVDSAGNVYANDRTHVAAYTPSAEPLMVEGEPLRIGLGTLDDAYGLAVSSFAATKGSVYVADAADDVIKVYEPAIDAENPSDVIDGSTTPEGSFSSLVDAALAVDPTNGHLLVADNLQPGFAHPQAAIYEFGAGGTFLGKLGKAVIDAEPPGLALDATGNLYATSGNDEEARVFSFGPYEESPAPLQAPLSSAGGAPLAASAMQGRSGSSADGEGTGAPLASASEMTQRGNVRVSFDGRLSPHALPRKGAAPVRVSVAAKIASTNGKTPPQLRKISIAINRNGRFDPSGLPICRLDQIQPSSTADALDSCRDSLVGEGHFSAKVLLAGQAPFPSTGKVHAFNSRLHGKPAILAHVYGTQPAPASYTLPFVIEQRGKGTFGTVLSASLPAVTSDSGYITGLEMTLGRSFSYKGKRRSYLSAGCPAPKGFPGATFPFAKASFGFGRKTVSSTLTRSCGVRGGG
jgi:hypothetical protein